MCPAPAESESCPRCGTPTTGGPCAACLLLAGAESLTRSSLEDAPTRLAGDTAASDGQSRLTAGDRFGAYRIERLLGRGGMGEVYEAEHLETGRRIALKILRGRLQQPEDRARFIREGQLAASISHPHAVYIFGSEEIEGQPIITMELLPGGTLRDRVAGGGPLPVADAVSAVLDIIGGLDAAQAAGILHRDIKPSNCFTDTDGSVKVGDFGLSISTLARDVRQDLTEEGFQGTPQFAPPEQLRGEPLDVRADIYAVGATLFYLLTGHAPYESDTLPALVTQVLDAPVPSLKRHRVDVPHGLARVVESCLAKTPAARPPSYADLADRLRPFARPVFAPAPPAQRFLAGVVDVVVLSLPSMVWKAATGGTLAAATAAGTSATVDDLTWMISVIYFGVLEGVWGASLGKRLFGLRVTADGRQPQAAAMVRRLAVYHLPVLTLVIPMWLVGRTTSLAYLQSHPGAAGAASLVIVGLMGLLFASARRENGWAALHDLASGLRVIATGTSHTVRARVPAAPPTSATHRAVAGLRCGPFDLIADLGIATIGAGANNTGRVLAGVDPVLRRRVWILAVPTGTPPVSAARRDVARSGRLRWLAGRRADGENWDAYEAPDGRAWTELAQDPAPWVTVRTWLRDAAGELVAARADATTPVLGTDRLWIRSDGHLVLLEMPAPGGRELTPPGNQSPAGLLAAVAAPAVAAAAKGDVLPLSARRLIARLRQLPAPALADLSADVAAVAASPAVMARWRRGVPIGLAALPLVILTVAATFAAPALRAFVTAPRMEMASLLEMLSTASEPASRLDDPAIRRSVEAYLRAAHGPMLTDPTFWAHPAMSGSISRLRPLAAEIASRTDASQPAGIDELRASIAPELREAQRRFDDVILPGLATVGLSIASSLATLSMVLVAVVSVAGAIVVPGGVVTRLVGLAVVTATGEEISRFRSVVRVLIAWTPLAAWLIWLGPSPVAALVAHPTGAFVVAGVMAVGAAATLARPTAGPHDRLTGATVIPQ